MSWPNVCMAAAAPGTAFLTLVPIVGDTIGRRLAAAIVGLSTGLMLAIVKAVSRNAYLVVHLSASERSSLTLGSYPILVGCTGTVHVLIPDDDCPAPIVARIRIAEKDVPVLEDHHGNTRSFSHGETLTYGHTRIEVRAEYLGAENRRAAQDASKKRADTVERARPVPLGPVSPTWTHAGCRIDRK